MKSQPVESGQLRSCLTTCHLLTFSRLMNKGKICYVDVDDTFVRSVGSTRIPIPHVIQKVKELKEQGIILYCWSSGGEDYARASAKEFEIENCFVGFLPKPNILLDDQRIEDWTYLSQVHPNSLDAIERENQSQ